MGHFEGTIGREHRARGRDELLAQDMAAEQGAAAASVASTAARRRAEKARRPWAWTSGSIAMAQGYPAPMPVQPARRATILLLLAAAAAVGAGCGGSSKPSSEAQVRSTLARFQRAVAAHDYTTICNRLLAGELLGKLDSIGLPCDQALAKGLGSVRDPRSSVGKVRVTGDRAYAVVHSTAANQKPSTDTVALIREQGSWRILNLAGTGPPAPPTQQDEP